MISCEYVIKELVAPTDTRDGAALAEHLSRCSSCAAVAARFARFDRLWQATQPAEPTPEVWENLWSQVICSLDSSTSQELVSPSPSAFWNGSASSSVLKFEANPPARDLTPSFRSRLWATVSVVGLSQAAAILLIAGLTWWFFVPSKQQQVASLDPATSKPAPPSTLAAPLPFVDIEEGHLVVILADPKSPSVVDRTPKEITANVDRAYLDWYGDERYFDWHRVFNEFESLAKPQVAMKE
jgi:hypothetical protein